MTQKNEKGLKSRLFGSIAVFMGICYLMAPLQHGLKELIHFLSHSLDQGVGHHSFASHSHNYDAHQWRDNIRKGISSHTLEAHEYTESGEIGDHGHPHTHHTKTHTHEIMDFMNMAFGTSTPIHQDNDKGMAQFNLDKHLMVINYGTIQAIPTFTKNHYLNIEENTSKGIQFLIVPPPKPLS
ncbi:MAG: hypothetical protein R2814_00205 [Flavobacteriaceae bacterium]